MDRLANLETVLKAVQDAVRSRDWLASERLSERVRTIILETAMADDRESLARFRERLMAFRLSAGRGLDAESVKDQRFAMLLRYDAALASLASRARPRALKARSDADLRPATDRVLQFLAERGSGATTTEITQGAQLAQGTVSRVLTELKAQGLVVSRRAGKNVVSRLTMRGRKRVGGRFGWSRRQLVRRFSPVPIAWSELNDVGKRGIRIELEEANAVVADDVQPVADQASDERILSLLNEDELLADAA